MKTIAAVSISGLLGLVAVSPAMAGGYAAPVAEAPVVVASETVVDTGRDWTGGYVGAQLGWADVSSTGGALDGNGTIGGLHAGYNYDFGKWVAGGELEYDAANTDLNGAGKLKGVTRVKARVGADLGRWMPYATAGWAHAKATVGGADLKGDGYFGGVGVDYALSDQWTVGGEVLAHRFKNFDNSGINVDPTTVALRASFNF